jgi:hypothetical protein
MTSECIGEPNALGIIIHSLILDTFKLLDAATPEIQECRIRFAPFIIKLHDGELIMNTGGI